ncbi:MAG: ferrochelatase [Planctomycetota bacterium]
MSHAADQSNPSTPDAQGPHAAALAGNPTQPKYPSPNATAIYEQTPAVSQLPYDSFLLVSFGGPEAQDEVMPFLRNVLQGKNVPEERMLEVSEHYRHFGGVSPINDHCRQLMSALEKEFRTRGIDLPMYWGNRNWTPMLTETMRQMASDGRRRTIAFFTSMFSCYSGCRQYRENIAAAQEDVQKSGELVAPIVEKVRMGFNHPKFIRVMAQSVRQAYASIDADPTTTPLLLTAHSIPMSMAEFCTYQKQLEETSRLVADAAAVSNHRLVFQSRSGPPQQPWLEPDICDAIAEMDDNEKLQQLVILPIGFVSDHMEVMFDLDEEAMQLCQERDIQMARAATAGTAPEFVSMVADLILERIDPENHSGARPADGEMGAWHDVCPADCCRYEARRPPGVGRPGGGPPAGRPDSAR